jgi:hypothetical protein
VKFVAHPLIVAVALGLLGPTALDADMGTPTPDQLPRLSPDLGQALGPESDPNVLSSDLADAPSAEDFERVQLQWEEARTWV